MSFFNYLLELSLDAAPYLLLGLVLAGLIKAWLPEAWVKKQLSGKGPIPVLKAALLGAPMPLCSCSVIPVALGIRRGGASKGATTSFLISTPETGVDSISLTYAMMGPVMAVVRPVAAVLTALSAGLWVNAASSKSCCASSSSDERSEHCGSAKEPEAKGSCCSSKEVNESCCTSPKEAPPKATSCCSSQKVEAIEKQSARSCCGAQEPEPVEPATSCCGSKNKAAPKASSCSSVTPPDSSCCASEVKPSSSMNQAVNGISYAFGRLYEDILAWLAVGLLIAAAVQTFVPSEWLAQWGSGWLAKFIMLGVGIPMYICASASTPMAAGLMLAGVSPGTVLVFLLAGPATNVSTMAILRNEMGLQVMVKYILTVMLGALLAGVLFDALLMGSSLDLVAQHHHHAEMLPLWLSASSLAILLLATITPLRQAFFRRLGAQG